MRAERRTTHGIDIRGAGRHHGEAAVGGIGTAGEDTDMADCNSTRLRSIVERFVTQLAVETEAAKSSAALLAYLKAATMFREYSFANTVLILTQLPSATKVAGYQTWRRLGRQVKRGTKSIRILAPVTYHKRDENDERTDEIAVTFRSVGVFDIADTTGPPLPEPPVLTGAECSDDLALALTLFADAQGIIVQSKK
jgi:hypothetical protein